MLNITRTWNAIGAAYGMRRPVALAIDYDGRALQLALLVEHAQWCLDQGKGERALAVANRFSRSRIELVEDEGTLGESQSMI